MQVMITAVDWDDRGATALRAAQRAELDARYGSDDHEPGAAPTAEDIAVFLVAADADGRPVGCGGLRLLDDGSAEIKRMYVVPEVRGAGASTAILRALEGAAAERGIGTLQLETGTAQPDAMRFYEREGYRPIPAFGPYVDEPRSRCYARTIA